MARKQKSYYKYKYLNNGSYWENEDDGGQPRKGLIAIHGLHLNILIQQKITFKRIIKI